MPEGTRNCHSGRVIPSLVPDRVEPTPPGDGGADRPSRWNWVQVSRIGGRSRFYELIQRGWIESDGNGRLRPTESFPIDVVAAFAALD
jgi:hypothetical protein